MPSAIADAAPALSSVAPFAAPAQPVAGAKAGATAGAQTATGGTAFADLMPAASHPAPQQADQKPARPAPQPPTAPLPQAEGDAKPDLRTQTAAALLAPRAPIPREDPAEAPAPPRRKGAKAEDLTADPQPAPPTAPLPVAAPLTPAVAPPLAADQPAADAGDGPEPVGLGAASGTAAAPALDRAAPHAPPQAAAANPPLDFAAADWAQKLAAHTAVAAAAGQGEISFDISPEKLGPLRLHIAVTEKGTEVSIAAASPEAARLLREAQPELQRMLAETGQSFAPNPDARQPPGSFAAPGQQGGTAAGGQDRPAPQTPAISGDPTPVRNVTRPTETARPAAGLNLIA